MTDSDVVRKALLTRYPEELVDECLSNADRVRSAWSLGQPEQVELAGGRFVEVLLRMLQYVTSGQYAPLGSFAGNVIEQLRQLEQTPSISASVSLRVIVPRVLVVIYTIRDKRSGSHVTGGPRPNLMDASLIESLVRWAVGELFRECYQCSPELAQHCCERVRGAKRSLGV